MNLIEKLMQADVAKCKEKETGIITSRRLAKLLGEKKPVEVHIQEIDQRLINEIMGSQYDKKGRMDFSKVYDAQLRAMVEGMTYPQLKDKELMKHFGCHTPKELAEVLFKGEAKVIAEKIAELSGIEPENSEDDKEDDTIKN